MIKINNINKYFNKGKSNETHVINNTTLDLPSKGLVALLGESGAGKTTLLNVIGGLDKYNSGSIEYDGTKFDKYKMGSVDKYRNENIGYIFQHYNLLPEYTVYYNLKLQLELLDICDPEEQDKRIKYALNAVGLYKFRKKLAGQLSGGQMQRVAIARALVKKTKILIADEPTGNLDSKNSVEIMNILKKISQIALVLLVTHDKPLAEYYADTIIDLKDGKVEGIRSITNASSADIKKRLDYKVYLGDMNKLSDGENTKTVIYSNEENPNVNLTLIEINGTYYIKSNVKIKNIEEANVEIIDGKYEEHEETQIEDKFNFDNSWYNDKKECHPIKSFFKELKMARISFKNSTKKAKILKVVLFVIGFILGSAAVSYYSLKRIDTSDLIKDDYAYEIKYNDVKKIYESDLYEFEETGISIGRKVSIDISYHKSYYNAKEKSYSAYTFQYSNIANEKLIAGEATTKENEIVLGKKLANSILNDFGFDNYKQLLNVNIRNYKVVGVSEKNTQAIYLNNLVLSSSNGRYFRGGIYGYDNYRLLKGTDIDENSSGKVLKVLTSDEYEEYLDNESAFDPEINSDAYISTNNYEIVGIAVLVDENDNVIKLDKYYTDNFNYIFSSVQDYKNAYYSNFIFNYTYVGLYNLLKDDIEFIEGSLSANNNREASVVVPYFLGYSVGDVIESNTYGLKDMVVTGVYKYKDSRNACRDLFLMSETDYYFMDNYYYNNMIVEVSGESDIEYLKGLGINLDKTIYEQEYQDLKDYQKRAGKATYIEVACLLVVCMVYIYFTMRSKMIADIYEIGVLRNIGSSRTRIVKKYIAQSLVSMSTTSFLGYIIYVAAIGGVTQALYKLTGKSYDLFASPYPYLGALMLVVISLVFGTLPIFTLLGKTPSEISAKYDI